MNIETDAMTGLLTKVRELENALLDAIDCPEDAFKEMKADDIYCDMVLGWKDHQLARVKELEEETNKLDEALDIHDVLSALDQLENIPNATHEEKMYILDQLKRANENISKKGHK